MDITGGPNVKRRVIASELKRLRHTKGVSQFEVTQAVELDPTALSRYEKGRSSMTVQVARTLLNYYGVTGDKLDWLLKLVKESRRRGWTADLKGQTLPRTEDLIALERDATSIQELEVEVIPGLIQTEAYANAMFTAGIVAAHAEKFAANRVARAAILTGERPVKYLPVIRESALRCQVGGRAVMKDQLEHLLEVANYPNVEVRIYPDDAGAHIAMSSPFRIMRFGMAPEYGVVYLDYFTGSLYFDDPDDVALYTKAHNHLRESALPPEESLALIERTRGRLPI